MAPSNKETFTELLEQAQKLPEIDSDLSGSMSPFANPLPPGDRVVNDLPDVEPVKAPKYPYRAHIKKFVIDSDEEANAEYEDIINEALRGEIIIRFEERTFTKEGDVIILMSWMTPVKAKKDKTS